MEHVDPAPTDSMNGKHSYVNFNGGEWSPKVDSRVDHKNYSAACRQLQNMIPVPHGAAIKRKGLQFIAETKDSTKESRLLRFQFSRDDTYCIEAGDLYFRFYRDGAQIMDGGSPYEIVTPYTEDEVKDIQFAQVNDVIFIVHPNHAPATLGRVSDTDWTLADVDYDFPALLDENTDISKTLQLSAIEGTGVTLTAIGHSPFLLEHVGSYWRLGQYNDDEVSQRLDEWNTSLPRSSASIFIRGKFTVETTSTWRGTIDIEESSDEAFTAPTTIRSLTSNDDKNYNVNYESPPEGAWYRATTTAGTDSDVSTPTVRIKADDPIQSAIVQVTAYVSATEVTVDVINSARSTDATDQWNEGAWSDVRGHPQAVTFYENRIVYAGTSHQPQTFWGSKTDDYYYFEQGDEETDSYVYTLASPERNEILWLGAAQQLLIGTTAGEWMATGNDIDTTITPTSIIVRQHSTNGSKALRPMLFEGKIVYAQRGGRKMRVMNYDSVSERFNSEDLTIMSDHLTAGEITSMAYQAQRDSIIWATNGLGDLISMTYEPDHEVAAWARHNTEGSVEWVETIYGSGDDEVWVIVQRQIEGVKKRYIENFRGYYNPTVDNGGHGQGSAESISIAFVIDTSGSMGDNITATVAALSNIAIDMEARYENSQFALIRYEADVETKTDFTDAATVIALMESLTVSGSDEFAYDAIVHAATTLSWDGGLNEDNIVYLATDESDTGSTETTASCITALQNIGCRFVYGEINDSGFDTILNAVGGFNFDDFETQDDDFIGNVPNAGYSEDATEQRFVDSSISYAGSPATVFTGIDHLEGEEVQILADGAVLPVQTVTGGQITIANPASVVHVGLQYNAILQPMRIDLDAQFGVMQGKEKRPYEAIFRLMDTGDLKMQVDGGFDDVRDLNDEPLYGVTPVLYTGESKPMMFDSKTDNDPVVVLKSSEPLPFTLVAMILKYNLTGK